MAIEDFEEALKGKNIPVLVLDHKWHRLFALNGKPDDIVKIEERLNELLARQGKLKTDIKDLKKLKQKLMNNIVDNMEGDEKKLSETKRLIEESNTKIEEAEDELLEIPRIIRDVNYELMLKSMEFCYESLRDNSNTINEISEWIAKIRIELKKNIIRKQNREIMNREMYSYMHDVLGADVMDIFDCDNMDINLEVKEKKD